MVGDNNKVRTWSVQRKCFENFNVMRARANCGQTSFPLHEKVDVMI